MEYREKVVCVLKWNKNFAFAVRHDHNKNRDFLIPPGGGVEQYETPEVAVCREMSEEVGMKNLNPRLIGVVENEFVWRGKEWHEKIYCFSHQCEFLTEIPPAAVDTNGDVLPIKLMTLQELHESALPVFPEGILEFLAE